jgi:hypothetical protein
MKEGVKLEWVTVPDPYFRLGIEGLPRACPCCNMTTLWPTLPWLYLL